MNTRNRTLGGFGLAVAALAALSVTACDPYTAANSAAPVVIGVSMTDTNYNEVVPPNWDGCVAPYPEVDKAWADTVYPSLCNPDNAAFGIPTVCPVACYPPRMGPGYAPLFTGNLGGTYKTTLPGVLSTYTYALPTAYVLGAVVPVPPVYDNQDYGATFTYGTIRILFNKLLDPKTVQPDPLVCQPPATANGLKVFRGGTDVTDTHSVCYVPNSDTEYWGASITVTSPDLDPVTETEVLQPNTTYRVAGTVQDQQGNTVDVDVTVLTGDNVVVLPPTPAAVRAK
jgi:hypothetical protein